MENNVSSNEEHIDNLDKQLVDSKINLSASEAKYDDISRKLVTLETDAARSNERAEIAEKKIIDIEQVSIVSYSHPSLIIIESQTQFHVERPWGQRPFSIVS